MDGARGEGGGVALDRPRYGRKRKRIAFSRPQRSRFRWTPSAFQSEARACLGGRETPAEGQAGVGRWPLGPRPGLRKGRNVAKAMALAKSSELPPSHRTNPLLSLPHETDLRHYVLHYLLTLVTRAVISS